LGILTAQKPFTLNDAVYAGEGSRGASGGYQEGNRSGTAEVGTCSWGLQPFRDRQLPLHLIGLNQQFLSQIKRKIHISRDFCGPDSSTPLDNSLQKLDIR